MKKNKISFRFGIKVRLSEPVKTGDGREYPPGSKGTITRQHKDHHKNNHKIRTIVMHDGYPGIICIPRSMLKPNA